MKSLLKFSGLYVEGGFYLYKLEKLDDGRFRTLAVYQKHDTRWKPIESFIDYWTDEVFNKFKPYDLPVIVVNE